MKKLILAILMVQFIIIVKAENIANYNNAAIKWYRMSPERQALYTEIFSLSKKVLLHNKIAMQKKGHKCGVIFDIDETLLDNSAYNEYNEINNKNFNIDSWLKFVNTEASVAQKGAVDITKYVHSLGCYVNLVSNRLNVAKQATINNLRKQGIYFDQVLLANEDKERKLVRFQAIANGKSPSIIKNKQIIIGYFGDNIRDFPIKNIKSFDNFGKLFFVLPNPMYGSWQ